MCGIAAVLLSPQARSAATWQSIRTTFTRNLVFNEERGKAATGLAVVQANGDIEIYKQAIPASEFVETTTYQSLLEKVGPNTTLILGHTRLPTQGSVNNPGNNHPIEAGMVLGVHNGHISNDDELFERWHLPRRAEVDSELIFQMLAELWPPTSLDDYLSEVDNYLAEMQGQFTFLAIDRRCPARLLVFKHENPLCLHYQSDWQALLFSSRYLFLRKAFGQSVASEALPHDHLMAFDANRLPEMKNHPVHSHTLLTQEEPPLIQFE